MKSRSHGFTLPELLITLALAAVILALGAPNFNEFRQNNRLTGIANDFLGALQTARSEAIKRQVSVSVCPSEAPEAMPAVCTEGAFMGWVAFIDENNNCEHEATEPVVRVGSRIDSDAAKPIYAVSNGNCVSFAATGFTQLLGTKTVASRTTFCDTRGMEKQKGTEMSAGRGIEVTPTGRTRITRVMDDLDDWTACPAPAEPEPTP